jgi:cell wall-associated NlpC family hydrolase
MRRLRQWTGPATALALLALAACTRAPRQYVERPSSSPVVARALPRLGYTLQAGAFAKAENAARFAQSLQGHGLEAAYYGSEDGLYRVRFGDFATKEKARVRGEALKAAGVIEAFWVVAPDGSSPGASGQPRLHPSDEGGLRAGLVDSAKGYLGVPYLFGGTTEKGFDCSGLTGAVYRLNGLRLPRSSQAQFDAGRPVDLDAAKAGDLLFFATNGGTRVSHVGLYLGQGHFIHAPRPGQGIRQDDLADRYYRRAFLGARSYL